MALPAAADAATTASLSDSATAFDTDIYAPLYTALQAWITSSFGEEVDNSINSLFGVDLIGDGANGVAGGTLADATGGAGGVLFGDGGSGATDAAGVGGDGGAAGSSVTVGSAGPGLMAGPAVTAGPAGR